MFKSLTERTKKSVGGNIFEW